MPRVVRGQWRSVGVTLLGSLGVALLGSFGVGHSIAQATTYPGLVVDVTNLRNQKGLLCLAVFAKGNGFPDQIDQAVQSRCIPITSVPFQVTFDNLTYGLYTVTAFHDENGDGEMNTGFLGIPQEGFGFSNNPKVRTAPPKPEDSFFVFTPDNARIQIVMKYF